MTHTKGPWPVAYYASQVGVSSSHYSVKKRDKTIVRTINQVATTEDESNARLIAAAPELLEACKAMIPWIYKGIESGAFDACVLPNAAHIAVKQAEKAIAKAEGR